MPESLSFNDLLKRAQSEEQVLKQVDKKLKKQIRVQFPCEVVSVDHEKQHCNVKILAKEMDDSGTVRNFPIIPNVPIRYPAETGLAYIRVPVQIGDTGTIEFFDTDISQYKKQGSDQFHDNEHYHGINNGLYTSGFYAEKNVYQISDPENTALEIGTKNGAFNLNIDKLGNTVISALTTEITSPSIDLIGATSVTGALDVTGAITAGNGATGTFDTITVASGIVTGGGSLAPYTLGTILYGNTLNELAKLDGNITATRKFLVQTGTGIISSAPEWFELSESILDHALLNNLNSTNYYHLTQASHTDLTDGGDSALHWHSISNSAKADIDTLIYGTSENPLFLLDAGLNNLFLGDGTNYTKFGSNGFITLHGTARRKQQYRIHAGSSTKGVSAPTDYLRTIGASGDVKKPVLQFSDVSQQDIYFEIHCPEDLDSSENPEFHLMWIPGASWTSGNYRWVLEYMVKSEDASYGDANTTIGTPTTIYMDATPSNNYDLIETKFTDKFIGVSENKIIICHLYRDVANDNADDVGEINFFEFTYISNKLGEEL